MAMYNMQHAGPPVYARYQETAGTHGLSPELRRNPPQALFFYGWLSAIGLQLLLLLPCCYRGDTPSTERQNKARAARSDEGTVLSTSGKTCFHNGNGDIFVFCEYAYMADGDPGPLVYSAEFFTFPRMLYFVYFLFLWRFQPVVFIRGMHLCCMFVLYDTPRRLEFGVRFSPGLHQKNYVMYFDDGSRLLLLNF